MDPLFLGLASAAAGTALAAAPYLRSRWKTDASSAPLSAVQDVPPVRYGWETGDKWGGGFGPTDLLTADYWTLRARSAQLFETNLYARGLVRRLVTNEINTGLNLEADPAETILGVETDSLAEWSETTETRFALWGNRAPACDVQEQRSFGALQAAARMEALVCGDVLVMLVQDQRTRLPRVRLVPGELVQSPWPIPPERTIADGVELDSQGRHVAFYVRQPDGTSKRLPAWGERSGRRLAWLVYGTDRRMGQVRGKPLLSLILQSLRDLDRYRDSALRKAVINSTLAMFITRDQDRLPSRALSAGATVRGVDTIADTTGAPRKFQFAEHIPGLVVEELSPGEDIKPHSTTGTDEAYGAFEEAMVQAIAWTNEVPPEILKLAFSNNYSASQAAINEFKIYLNRIRTDFGAAFCQPIYSEWLIAETLQRRIDAPGLLEAWRDRTDYAAFGAWTAADWTGHVKPSTDLLKQARGYEVSLALGLITRDRAAREMTGMKFSKCAKQLKRENAQLAEALEPLEPEPAPAPAPPGEGDEGEAPEPEEGEEGDEDDTDEEEAA